MRALHDLAYRGLVGTAPLARSRLGGAVWDRAWAAAGRHLSGPVPTTLHGRRVVVNAGYSYPAFSRRWPTYNDPLVELVHLASVAQGRPITAVDVGAAVGDTVLLVRERCPGEVGTFHCVEGDPEFFGYLETNLGHLPGVQLHRAMLSDTEGTEADLVRTHLGTASAQGATTRSATTLDLVLQGTATVDVLKVDTDGFDGKVLAGARSILSRHRPALIFEWHPLLCEATGQDWRQPFEVLADHGYRWFAWFTKEGEWSHLHERYHPAEVAATADLCLTRRGPRPDWHYDVVALHEDSAVPVLEVAALGHARQARLM